MPRCFACGRGASWVWGARVLNLGARRYRSRVGVDAGACGLVVSRRTRFVGFPALELSEAIFGARGARAAAQRATARRRRSEGLAADAGACGLVVEPGEACFARGKRESEI